LSVIDEGHPIHYSAVQRGTPVYSSDGVEVGKVDDVLDNYREHILDGIVIEDGNPELRFADGPEVQRTFERAVILNITAEEAARLPAPERGAGVFRPRRASGRLSKLFGGGWKRQ
jgi:sporulation protein YlmC with PRC-barrel domain